MGFAGRFASARRFLPQADDLRKHAVVLMRVRAIGGGSMFSLLATVLSTAILTVLAVSLTERGLHPFEALYAHSFSTVARVLIPVPGGYGVSDGSLTGLLNYLGIGLARATFVALAYRTVITVFRTIFGLMVLVARYPHLLVGQLRVPEQRPAAVPVFIRERPIIPVRYSQETQHNGETTDGDNRGDAPSEREEPDADAEAGRDDGEASADGDDRDVRPEHARRGDASRGAPDETTGRDDDR
jgi:hypothetical protein